MTEPIFYCYDDACGFEQFDSFEKAEERADDLYNYAESFTEGASLHCGIIIPFKDLIEGEEDFSFDLTSDKYAQTSIQELDKRGLNATANDMLKKMLLVIDKLNTDRPNAADFLRANTSESNTAFLDGKESALTFAIDEIKKALGVS